MRPIPRYNEPLCFRFPGLLDGHALQRALNMLAASTVHFMLDFVDFYAHVSFVLRTHNLAFQVVLGFKAIATSGRFLIFRAFFLNQIICVAGVC